MALRQIVEDNNCSLLRCLDPSLDLLGKLRSVTFVKDRISAIKKQTSFDEKNDALLTSLLEVPDDLQQLVLNEVAEALRSCGQGHVANIFRRESHEIPMSDEHYRLLSKNRVRMCQLLELRDGLLDSLVRDDVFTETHRRSVLTKSSVDLMAQETLNILLRRSDSDFDKFVGALNENDQSHVTYLLTGVGRAPISDEHCALLRRKMEQLCKFLDPENGLLVRLYSAGIIGSFDCGRVRSVSAGYNEMARKLLQILRRKSDDAFDALKEALNNTGQSHVIHILTGEGNSEPVNDEFRKKLTENRTYLVKTIDSKCSGLVSALISKGVFSEDDQQRVMSRKEDTDADRSEVIMDLVARKSQSAFDGFIEALVETGQKHVAVEFIGEEVVANILVNRNRNLPQDDANQLELELREYIQTTLAQNGINAGRLNQVLQENGLSITRVNSGSIVMVFRCRNLESLDNLERLCACGILDELLTQAFCPEFLDRGVESLIIEVPSDEFRRFRNVFTELRLMTEEHREALLSSADWLVDKIDVSSNLLDRLSLCGRRRQAIERAATRERQVKTLLDILSRQPDSAYTQLLAALDHTQQHDTMRKISESENVAATADAGVHSPPGGTRESMKRCFDDEDEQENLPKTRPWGAATMNAYRRRNPLGPWDPLQSAEDFCTREVQCKTGYAMVPDEPRVYYHNRSTSDLILFNSGALPNILHYITLHNGILLLLLYCKVSNASISKYKLNFGQKQSE